MDRTISREPQNPSVSKERAWDRFFFDPADPRPLGAMRVAVGALLVWNWLCLAPDLFAFLGSDGWADPALAQALLRPGAWSIWFYVPDQALWVAWSIGLLAMIALTVGVGTRVAAGLSWVFVVSTLRRTPVIQFGFDNVMAIWTFYLAVTGAAGQAYSLDQWLRRNQPSRKPFRETTSANLGLRLIQLHLCLIYASAGLAKLQGRPWWDGSAVGMLIGNSEFRPFDLAHWAEFPILLELATHATVAFEILYPVLIWLPAWRPWFLLFAVVLHVGIAFAMGLTEFSFAMLAGNLAFVPAAWFAKAERVITRTAV